MNQTNIILSSQKVDISKTLFFIFRARKKFFSDFVLI
jgi:hypothetical protein